MRQEIGIIIPVSSGESRLEDTLYYIKERTRLPYRVLVCSNEENTRYGRICKKYGADLHITTASLGEAKNQGAAYMVDCGVIVFMDAHVKVDKGWDMEIASILRDKYKSIGIATLHTYVLDQDFVTEKRGQGGAGFSFSYELKRDWCAAKRNGEVAIINGAFQAFRTKTFWHFGGFIPFHDEDIEISLRSNKFGYRNVCGQGQIGHVFKALGGGHSIAFTPTNDYQYGDLLIAYLYYPELEYEKFKEQRGCSKEFIEYIERNFKKLKEYIFG